MPFPPAVLILISWVCVVALRIAVAVNFGSGSYSTLVDCLRRRSVEVVEPADAEVLVLPAEELSPQAKSLAREAVRKGQRVLMVRSGTVSTRGSDDWQLLRSGADDVLPAGSCDAIADLIAARLRRWQHLATVLDSELVTANLIGSTSVWRRTLGDVVETGLGDSSLLLMGESGTGKELLARLLHAVDPRPSKKDLMVLDCGTVVPELSGSEFFGHERGAFTGAQTARDGAFALADGGTLFLDEIGELPLPLQAQLLRVIQERTYKRVGGNTWHRTNFRLVAATNRNLLALVEQGRFRADLYYRLAATIVRVPPLRERRGDILPLARHFLPASPHDKNNIELSADVEAFLVSRDYPGNVRELRQLIGRMLRRHPGTGPLTAGCVPEDDRPALPDGGSPASRPNSLEDSVRQALTDGYGLRDISKAATDTAIAVAVSEANGSLRTAARRLGITDRALQLRRAAEKG